MKIGNCSLVRTGLVFSRKEASPKTKCYMYNAISLKNITEDGLILADETERFWTVESLKNEYFTHIGDVLLRLSAPYTSALITEKESGLLVPSHFAIIRVNETVVPAYLHWWLMKNRKQFYKIASGTSMMGTISSGYVSEIEFEVLPLHLQAQIGELIILANREQNLIALLADKKRQFVNATITNIKNQNKEML